jgi:hypothetical protein
MTDIDYEPYDRAVLTSVTRYLMRLARTVDEELTPRDLVAKYNAVVPLLRLIAMVKTCRYGTILDTVLAYLDQEWREAQYRCKGSRPESDDDFKLWFWYGGLASDILWERVRRVPVRVRLSIMVELLDELDPGWRRYVKRSWCREGMPIISQVFFRGETLRMNLFGRLYPDVLPEQDLYQSILWLARRGLIARDPRAGGVGKRQFDRTLARCWWEEARANRPNRRAIPRTLSAPLLSRQAV